MWVLYDSPITMAPIEKRDISSLPEWEKDSYKNIDELKSNIDLKNEINDNLFAKLENGNAAIERHNWNLIFKIKDLNSRVTSTVNINWETFGGYSFRVKRRTLKNFLEKEQNTTETSAHYNALLNKLLVVKNTQNELATMRQNLDFNADVTEDNVWSMINSLIWYYNDVNNHRNPRTYSKDSRKWFKELKNKARGRYSKLLNIKDDLEKRSYKDISQYIKKTQKYLNETQEFDHNWQKIVMKQYPGNISTDIDNTTDAKNERKYQEWKLRKNNKFNSDLEKAEVVDEANETLEVMQAELIADLDDTENLINNSDQKFKGRLTRKIDEFRQTVSKVKSMKEMRVAIVRIVYEVDDMEKNSLYQNKVKLKIKTKIWKLKLKYKWKIPYNLVKTDMINNWSYQTMRQECKRSWWANWMLNNMLVDWLAKIWLIDKSDKDQVEAVKKAGNFALIVGWVVLAFKFLTNLFKAKDDEKNPNKRRNTALYGAGLYGLFNVDKLMNWGKDIYWWWKNNNTLDDKEVSDKLWTDQETVSTYITPPYTTLAAIWWIPINTLTNPTLGLIGEDNWKFEIDYKKYEAYINSKQNKLDKDAKATVLANLKILEKDWWDMLNDWLNKLWINDLDDMKKISWKDNKKTLLDSDKVLEYSKNVAAPVNKDLAEEWLKPVNSKAWYEITQEFDKNKTDNDKQIAEWIKRWLIKTKNATPYVLKDMAIDNNLDLANKTINWLNLKFKTYDELFRAKTLTNFIKKEFKNKVANSKNPFNNKMFIWNIQFDNANRKTLKADTDVIRSNPYQNTLEEISPILAGNKPTYINYLNSRWNIEWKVS